MGFWKCMGCQAEIRDSDIIHTELQGMVTEICPCCKSASVEYIETREDY
ncbi:MAG: hypothetical protein R6U96_18605 [Promethearchaeia archaeon]